MTETSPPDNCRLLLDVDGVIFDFVGEYRTWFSQATGRPLDTLPNATSWSFWKEQWDVTTDEFLDVYAAGITAGKMFQAPPTLGSVEALHVLANAGVSINIVTSRLVRGVEDAAVAATHAWIERYAIPHDSLTIVADDKTPTAGELGLNTAVDDSVQHYEELDAIGVDVWLFDQPYNTHHRGRRVTSLFELGVRLGIER